MNSNILSEFKKLEVTSTHEKCFLGQNGEELHFYQNEIKRLDPNRSDLWFIAGERLNYISYHELYKVLGYKKMREYLEDSQDLLNVRKSSCYNYMKAVTTFKKRITYFINANLALDNYEVLMNAGLYTKLILLEKAFKLKCSRTVSRQNVFDKFLSSSYMEFLYYIYPEKEKEAIFKNKCKPWERKIKAGLKRTGLVKLIPYYPGEINRAIILDTVLNVSKEFANV